jgi:hypothetical protein
VRQRLDTCVQQNRLTVHEPTDITVTHKLERSSFHTWSEHVGGRATGWKADFMVESYFLWNKAHEALLGQRQALIPQQATLICIASKLAASSNDGSVSDCATSASLVQTGQFAILEP